MDNVSKARESIQSFGKAQVRTEVKMERLVRSIEMLGHSQTQTNLT